MQSQAGKSGRHHQHFLQCDAAGEVRKIPLPVLVAELRRYVTPVQGINFAQARLQQFQLLSQN